MKVCAVTCTGGRPELFELCKRWVMRQTLPVDYWIVATDNGEKIENLPQFARHIHVDRVMGPGPNTDFVPNHTLRNALLMVPDHHCAVVFEDDDWYAPDHVHRCVEHLGNGHEVVYGATWVRYHLPTRCWNTKMRKAPGEGRVCIRSDAVRKYAASLVNRPLYEGPTDGRYPGFSTVGIKGVGYGLPGRPGASDMHKGLKSVNHDPDYAKFRSWLGPDAEAYISLVQPT